MDLQPYIESVRIANNTVHNLCAGKQVRILSNFNGQQFGSSKPSLKGRIFKVTHAFIDNNEVVLWLDMDRYRYSTNAIGAKEVEFL